MDKWLSNANETLAECLGVGDQQSTQIKLSSINVSSFLIKFFYHHLSRRSPKTDFKNF